jgi:hypothetical protein
MPSTVSAVFAAAGLFPEGVVQWGTPIPRSEPGVYAVAITDQTDDVAQRCSPCRLSPAVLNELLDLCPELRVDDARPDRDTLGQRLTALWLPDEVIAYIGLAGTSLRTRVRAYYSTPLGARGPHAGGWPLKTLSNLGKLWVHFAACSDPCDAELEMLGAFQAAVSASSRAALQDPELPIPFANLEWAKGQRKRHGITGAREPARPTRALGR